MPFAKQSWPEGGRLPALALAGVRLVRGCLSLAVLAFVASGCGYQPPSFHANLVYTKVAQKKMNVELVAAQQQSIADTLSALFGTPDDPHAPALDDAKLAGLLNESQLRLAAGPVGREATSEARGLYREHCAHCHGVTGDGRGPTAAFLNPYPRDYRKGVYKFKSTPKGLPPTHADLKRTLVEGIPGTAMPSFKLLHDDQLEALMAYVRYLSLRGEVETALVDFSLGDEVEEKEPLLDASWSEKDPAKFAARLSSVKALVAKAYGKWAAAEAAAVEVPKPPENFHSPESIRKGNELFHGKVAICVTCHGETALGDGQITDYDDWTKVWFDPTNAESREKSLALVRNDGVLPLRNVLPRNLRAGNYRGGHRPLDLYWRIINGIDGTPMPAANMRKPTDGPAEPKLTTDDVWHLVAYVQSLPYEPLSQREYQPTNQRERN